MKRLFLCVMFLGLLFPCGAAFAQGNQSIFIIGSNQASINGLPTAMDVSPYIKDNRTFLPIRYVAHALGIPDEKILWDQDAQRVFLFDPKQAVTLQLGSNILTVSGASTIETPMDVVPIVVNDRVCLPISHIAKAFGATASWDGGSIITIDLLNVEPIEVSPTKQTITYPNGNSFTGMVLNGIPNGHGTLTVQNGVTLEGNFTGDQPHGYLFIRWPDGSRYEGNSLNALPEGQGKLTFKDGSTIEGSFIQGKLNGYGYEHHPEGYMYWGYFKENVYNGHGIAKMPDGTMIEGEFANGLANGNFTVYYPNGTVVSGFVVNGQVVNTYYSYKPSSTLIPSTPKNSLYQLPSQLNTINTTNVIESRIAAIESQYNYDLGVLNRKNEDEKQALIHDLISRGFTGYPQAQVDQINAKYDILRDQLLVKKNADIANARAQYQ